MLTLTAASLSTSLPTQEPSPHLTTNVHLDGNMLPSPVLGTLLQPLAGVHAHAKHASPTEVYLQVQGLVLPEARVGQ